MIADADKIRSTVREKSKGTIADFALSRALRWANVGPAN
jgi:hypothetical protein